MNHIVMLDDNEMRNVVGGFGFGGYNFGGGFYGGAARYPVPSSLTGLVAGTQAIFSNVTQQNLIQKITGQFFPLVTRYSSALTSYASSLPGYTQKFGGLLNTVLGLIASF